MSLKDCIARDVNTVFLNPSEFCDNLKLQIGTEVLPVIGSLQQNLISNNSGAGSVLQQVSWSLYIKYPLMDDVEKRLSSGTRITVNDKPYTVVEVADELGLCRIGLSTRVGR